MVKFTRENPVKGKYSPKVLEATILDMNDGTYAISWPFGYDDDEYRFKTVDGAIKRLERYGFVRS